MCLLLTVNRVYLLARSNHGAELDAPEGLTLIVVDSVWCTFWQEATPEHNLTPLNDEGSLLLIVYGLPFGKKQQWGRPRNGECSLLLIVHGIYLLARSNHGEDHGMANVHCC